MNRMILQTVVCIALVVTMPSCSRSPQAQQSLGKGELIQRKPEPQAVLSALGLHTWQVELPVPDNKPYDLAVYSRGEHKAARPVNGTLLFNRSPDGPQVRKITATVAIQVIQRENGDRRFLVGMNADTDSGSNSWTQEIENPFLPAACSAYAGSDLKIDAQGRVPFAFSEGGRSVASGRPIEDYSSVIYLQFTPASK